MNLPSITAAALLCGQVLIGQGTLTFLNTPTGTGTVAPGVGAPVSRSPTSARLTGPNYWAQLYASSTQNGSYAAIGVPVNFRSGPAAGYVAVSSVTVPGVAPGEYVWVQMRAWEGTIGSSYEQAVATAGMFGYSNTINVGPLGGLDPAGGAPFTAPYLFGLQAFAIGIVPEPATWMLCLSGLALVAAHRRPVRRTPPSPTI